ncbi:MAG: SulP family inorganic anion transporter [Burkholderiaceae bacterium]
MPQFNRFHRFRPRLLDTLKGYDRDRFGRDLGAGITVGIVALPLAMAFAVASGVKPEQGLITAIVAGFLISALGGSNVQIGGPAGAFIVIVYGIVARYGLTNLLISTALAGVLMFTLGALRLGVLVRYVPVTVVIGFTNGIAVLIALSQLRDLLGLRIAGPLPADFFAQINMLARHLDSFNPWAFGLGLACLAGLFVWPRLFLVAPAGPGSAGWRLPTALTGARAFRMAGRTPAPIVALVTLSVLAAWLELPVETIGARFGEIPRSLPALELPGFSWESAKQLMIPTLTIALLGAVESLLCARIADDMSELPRHDPNQELMAQGIANFVTPFFGGIPATGTIARTVTNLRAGAVSPIAGIVHSLTVLAVVLVAAPLAAHVPLAVLAGILLFVAWNMGEWHEFARLRHFTVPYRTVLIGTFVLTVVFDLMVAVEVGLVLACGFFIWRMGQLFRIERAADDHPDVPPGVRVLHLYGNLFFGAIGKLESLADGLGPEVHTLVLEMHRMVSMDNSGLAALQQLAWRLSRMQVRLLLADLNEQPGDLIRRSGFAQTLGPANLAPDLAQALAALHDAARAAAAAVAPG